MLKFSVKSALKNSHRKSGALYLMKSLGAYIPTSV